MNRKRVVLLALVSGLMAVVMLWLQVTAVANAGQAQPTASALAAPAAGVAPAPNGRGLNPRGSNAYGFEHFADALVSFDVNNAYYLNYIAYYGGANLFVGADFLPGDNQMLYAIEAISGTFSAVDTFTGQRLFTHTLTTATPGEFWTGMATDPTTGILYASTGESQCTPLSVSYLYTVDPQTAQATLVGPLTLGPCLIAISFDGQGQLYGLEIVNDELIKIDKTTAAATVVGPIGFDANFSQGMDFDEATNTMYLAAVEYDSFTGVFTSSLRTADLATGQTTFVEFLGSGFYEELGTIAFARPYTPTTSTVIDPATGGQIVYADPLGFETRIDVPPNAVSETVALFFSPVRDPGFIPGFTYANRAFDLDLAADHAYLPLIVNNTSVAAGRPAAGLPGVFAAPSRGTQPGGPGVTFLQPVTVTIEYSDADVSQIQDEDSLRLYYLEESSGRWIDAINTCPQPGGYTSDPVNNVVQLQICHLTRFGLVGN